MQDKSPQDIKQDALDMLARILPAQREQLRKIDERMVTYYEGLLNGELHNLYEVLGGIKFLRVLRTYPFSHKKVNHAIQLYEGRWKDGEYIPDSGGLQFSGLKGFTHYRLQPFQVFALAGLFGPHKFVDGDKRRLCTELVLYLTRKSGKTLMSAFIQFYGFFFMDSNFEGFCCANSADQARLLYRTAQSLIRQMDAKEERIRFTASQTNWKPGQPRQASITALSAGGKTKDGLFAQLCCADEFGSADFTNGKSDMLDLVSVVQSSMGPRREPLTVISTTAGYATNGPFKRQLDLMQEALERELELPDDCAEPQPDDYQHALLLQPDPWEQQDEDALLTDERIWRKSNPMIGISVQPSFYEQEAYKARMNPDNRKEFITKLVNVYQSNRTTKWLTGDQIRPRQVERCITDCKYEDGWNIFVGLDFGGNDDLFAITYLGVNYRQDVPPDQRMFADCEVWIVEKAMEESPNRKLYELWVEQGWLKVCPGEVFNPDAAINDLMAKNQQGLNLFMFGYDPAQSIQPINTIKAWLQSLGIDAQTIKKMVVPVPQSFVNMNGLIQKIEWLLLGQEYNMDTGGWSYTNDTPFLFLSNSPLWPWGFQNAKVEISSSELRAIRKTTPSTKIDMIHALLDACFVFDLSEGNVQQ